MRQKSKYRCSLSSPPFFEASIQISRCFVMMQIGYFPLNPNHQIEQSGHIDLRDGRSVNR